MELYQTFTTIAESVTVFLPMTEAVLIGSAIGAFSLWLALFLLQGFGLFKMAKNRAFKHKWLAFIPFVNLIYIGKLVGVCIIFGRPMKRAGTYAMITQLLSTLVVISAIVIQTYLTLSLGTPKYDQFEMPYWNASGGLAVLEKMLVVFLYLLPILQLIYTIFIAILSFALYKKYAPSNYFILGMLTFLVPISRYIIVFALRKKQAVNFEEYMRKKREDFIRQQQQYGYGPYGNPYQNPYANPYGQQPPPEREDSPFSDFSNGRENPKDEHDPDGFFD